MDVKAEAKRLRNEYAKAWRAKNPEKVKAAQERFWEKKARENTQEESADD